MHKKSNPIKFNIVQLKIYLHYVYVSTKFSLIMYIYNILLCSWIS